MNRNRLLATAATALCLAAAPAYAQTAETEAMPSAEGTSNAVASEERLIALAVAERDGSIRPFGGDVGPSAGRIRTFAGEVTGTAGKIRTFYGDAGASAGTVLANAGRIRTFAGRIRTFSYDVSALSAGGSFWGTLTPQTGSLSAVDGQLRTYAGQFDAMAGKIRTFAGKIRTFSGTLLGYDDATLAYTALNGGFQELYSTTKATWGTTIQLQTGKSFDDAFANRMLAKYGIDLANPQALDGLNEVGVELFLLDWYDNLMLYSGRDSADHWMKAVNWSPALTQSLGNGADTKIGVLDFNISGDEKGNVVKSGGYSTVEGIHGSAVASLIVAPHDKRGVMGIAPNAQVLNYNPFDETMTAGWSDIRAGVRFLMENGASVINMSLGVPGYVLHSGWNESVFVDRAVADKVKSTVFVLAAGNDGVIHPADYMPTWDYNKNPNIIIVGSVDPDGVISEFSNRPGDGKINRKAGNDPLGTDMLRDRFIVAPGEWMLVSDGQGGVTRMSGTSFAAPLVSGTIALVHDRWPWLADNPEDTVKIILNSARDVGAPGVDGVYGRGMLDVERALSPTDFFALEWKETTNGVVKSTTANQILNTKDTTRNTWEANGVYFTVFETVGSQSDSYRDFNIPMSSKLVGQTVGNSREQFNGYLRSRFQTWFDANRKIAQSSYVAPIASIAGMDTTATATPREWRPGLRQSDVPFDTGLALRSPDGRVGFRFGSGDGATVSGQEGFGFRSDYDVTTGGANPFLGLASGAGYAAIEMRLGEQVTLSTGVSHQNAVMDMDRMTPDERRILGSLDPYRATANTLAVTYKANSKLSTNISYTLLNESSALLGVRSLNPSDMRNGSATDAATLGADYVVTKGMTLSTTGTLGRTRPGSSQGIAVAGGGLVSSAWQVAAAKNGVFGGSDRLRLTLAQPLHVEAGRIGFTGVEVIDRQTGALGEVTQYVNFDSGKRRYVAEAMYGRGMIDGAAQLNLFGRVNLGNPAQGQAAVTLGSSFQLSF